jgi:hypothetical protein
MWASTLLGLAVVCGLAVFGLGPDYQWALPYLVGVAVLFLIASIVCLSRPFWPQDRKLFAARYKMVCEALNGIPIDAGRREWLERLLTGARPQPIAQHVWNTLQQKGIVEGDFHGPKGLVSGFEPALIRWLRDHPSNNNP